MENKTKKSKFVIPVILVAVFLLAACGSPGETSTPTTEPVGASSEGKTLVYTLQAVDYGSQHSYIGIGGDINGVINPILTASVGDTVRIILIAADSSTHDIVISEFDAASDFVRSPGDTSEIMFKVTKEGRFEYHASLAPHMDGGMSGSLVVSALTEG